MNKRSTKWYRKNEEEVMNKLGLIATKNSGAGFVEKEDGYNDEVLAQLKSTDKESIKVNLLDIEKLEYHASVEHKLPVFVLEFIQSNDIYLLVKPVDLSTISKYLNAGELVLNEVEIPDTETTVHDVRKPIKSSAHAKNSFYRQKENERKEADMQWQNQMKRKKQKH